LHDSLVLDRKLIASDGLASAMARVFDNNVLAFSDLLVFDSYTNLSRFTRDKIELRNKSIVVPISPPPCFNPQDWKNEKKTADVLLVADFSPLTGGAVVKEALQETRLKKYAFTVIGREHTGEGNWTSRWPENVKRIEWVPYDELPRLIAQHKIALGIFGGSQKAASVLPNKVMEALRVGVPCITREGEISYSYEPIGCFFIKSEDPAGLADAVDYLLRNHGALEKLEREAWNFSTGIGEDDEITKAFLSALERIT
jgi:glycosyltransferase involved in cell wall biosynthesis